MSLRFWSWFRYYVYPLDNNVALRIAYQRACMQLLCWRTGSKCLVYNKGFPHLIWLCDHLLLLTRFATPIQRLSALHSVARRDAHMHACIHKHAYECTHMHTLYSSDGLAHGSLVTANCFQRESPHWNTLITSGWVQSIGKVEQYRGRNDDENEQASGHSQLCESCSLLNNTKIKCPDIQQETMTMKYTDVEVKW